MVSEINTVLNKDQFHALKQRELDSIILELQQHDVHVDTHYNLRAALKRVAEHSNMLEKLMEEYSASLYGEDVWPQLVGKVKSDLKRLKQTDTS